MDTTENTMPVVTDVHKMIEFASDGIVSKTVIDKACGKVVLFCMSSGQSLSEHTASSPATVHVLQGTGEFRLGEEVHQVKSGTWIHMPADLHHAVKAKENLVFVLTLFRS